MTRGGDDLHYRCITTLAELREYLEDADIVAFDIETSPTVAHRNEPRAALDPHKATICGISFSRCAGDAVYVPVSHRVGTNADGLIELWQYLSDTLFNSITVTKICHNISFESAFLYARGIVLQPPVYDTMLGAMLTTKAPGVFRKMSDSGLKTLAAEKFDTILSDFETVTGWRHYDELDPQDAETIRYACADSDFAFRLYISLNRWFDQAQERTSLRHRQLLERIESPAAVYTGIMKHNGLPVDKPLMGQKGFDAFQRLNDLRREIDVITGGVDIGANAGTAAFKSYLFNTLGLPVVIRTEKNREAANDEAMILLSEHCAAHRPELVPLFKAVLEYRKWGKIQSTYIDGYQKQINSATGRIHPDLLSLGTETGRYASRRPNCQNMPRPGNDAIGVRDFFAAPEGKALLSLDFSQIELRVGAFFCRDEKMLEVYRTGGDIHAATTAVLYGITPEQAADKNTPDYKEHRAIAKNTNFGIFFGLFPNGLQRNLKFKAGLDTPVEECERIIANIKKGYPGLARWQEVTKKQAANSMFTETYFGRRRYLHNIRSGDWSKMAFDERVSLNHPIQGTAAEILKLAMGRILAGLPDRPWLLPLLQVHDELLFELPAEKVGEAVAFIKGCMEAQPSPLFDVPIIAEAAVGQRYGEMKEL